MKMVAGLQAEGIPLLIGTDLTLPSILPGFSVHEEMVLWQEVDLSPLTILRSATITPVRFMGLEQRLGSFEAGKDASPANHAAQCPSSP